MSDEEREDTRDRPSGAGEPGHTQEDGTGTLVEAARRAPMTRADLREIYTIAAAWPALVFWTRGNEGDWQPLLMPVTSDMLAEQ